MMRSKDGGAANEQTNVSTGEGSCAKAGNEQVGSSGTTRSGIVGVGQLFEDANHFRRVLKTNAILSNRSFIYKKNEIERVVAVCSDKDCLWKIRAALHTCDGTFGVRTCNLIHTCGVDNLKERGHPRADANWIAGVIKEKLRGQTDYRPVNVIKDLHRSYGVEVPYHRAWMGKEIAMMEIHGADARSFDGLGEYCDMVVQTNPGSTADLEICPVTNKFQRIFICLSACVRGFVNGCRRLIILDGTHITSKWKGCLLSAVSNDANDGIFTIAEPTPGLEDQPMEEEADAMDEIHAGPSERPPQRRNSYAQVNVRLDRCEEKLNTLSTQVTALHEDTTEIRRETGEIKGLLNKIWNKLRAGSPSTTP